MAKVTEILNGSGILTKIEPGANLHEAYLRGADLSGADLSGADLSGANLRGANLRGANLRGANLYEADLSGADLYEADLSGANLRGANLSRADLSGANLRGANLSRADLRGADLSGADLSGADLRGADLGGADLSGAKNLPSIKEVKTIKIKIKNAISVERGCLNMSSWHTCETSHCLAGWAVTLHPEGKLLESLLGTNAAAALIFNACVREVPNFYSSNEAAIEWLNKK